MNALQILIVKPRIYTFRYTYICTFFLLLTKLDYTKHTVHWMNSYLFFKIQLLIMPLILYFPIAPYTCHHYSVYPIINTFCPNFCIYGIHGNLPFKSPLGHLLEAPVDAH